MSDFSQGPGWWVASDGKWYPPELHPSSVATSEPAPPTVVPPGPAQGGYSPHPGEIVAISAARGSRLSRMPKALVAGITALVAILLAIVILIVTSGGAVVASALFGTSGTATIDIRVGGTPTFSGAFGSDPFSGTAVGVGGGGSNDTSASFSGTLGGTAFSLTSTEDATFSPGETSVPDIKFAVRGEYGRLPVRGTLTWDFSSSNTSGGLGMSIQGTVGSHTLQASGSVTESGTGLVGTFHYSVT